MFSIDPMQCISQLRKFVPGSVQKKSRKQFGFSLSAFEPELPCDARIRPQTLYDVEVGLTEWKKKIEASHIEWSDPAREEELDQYVSSTQQVMAESHFKDYELSLHQKRRQDELLQKTTSRKRLKPATGVLGITKEDALAAIAEKRRKEDELAKRREHNMYMKFWRTERDDVLAKGIIARRDEKARIKRIKDYIKRGVEVPDKDKDAIVDPEVE